MGTTGAELEEDVESHLVAGGWDTVHRATGRHWASEWEEGGRELQTRREEQRSQGTQPCPPVWSLAGILLASKVTEKQ